MPTIKHLLENDISLYEKQLKKYIYELLTADNTTLSEDELNHEAIRLYSNMCKYSRDESAIIIGAFEDSLIGFLWAYKMVFQGKDRYHISYFIVNNNSRNLGIGTKLLDYLYDMAVQNNIKEIELMVKNTNVSALEFYKRHDFHTERFKLYKKL